MRNAIFATCSAVAMTGAISLSAQTTPNPSTPSTPQASTGNQTVTVTGCLKPWTGTSMGAGSTTPGSTAGSTTGATPAMFLLTNADDASSGATGTMGSGTTGSGTPGSTTPGAGTTGATTPGARTGGGDGDKQYTLTASTSVNLAEHLNKQVRVTGTLSKAAPSSAMGSGSTTGTTGSTGSTGSTTTRPGETPRPGETAERGHAGMTPHSGTIAVSSVTMVSATCTGNSR